MRMLMLTAAALAIGPVAASAQGGAMDEVLRLVDRFDAARAGRDPAALAATLAADYEEVSPIGDVDTRARVLGFYAPRPGAPAPAMTTAERTARVVGDGAIVTERRSFTPPGAAAPRAMRIRYLARRERGRWMLVSAQYTPIPPAR